MLEERLKGREYILGSYGIADIKIFGWARIATRTGLNIDEFPNVKAWVERIEARPASLLPSMRPDMVKNEQRQRRREESASGTTWQLRHFVRVENDPECALRRSECVRAWG